MDDLAYFPSRSVLPQQVPGVCQEHDVPNAHLSLSSLGIKAGVGCEARGAGVGCEARHRSQFKKDLWEEGRVKKLNVV